MAGDLRLPDLAAEVLGVLAAQLREVAARVREVEPKLWAWHRADAASRRLESVPGLGPVTASAIVATVGDPRQFRSGRPFAAWLGLVPSSAPAVARNGWVGSPNAATVTSGLGRYVITPLILSVLTALSFMMVQFVIARMETSEGAVAQAFELRTSIPKTMLALDRILMGDQAEASKDARFEAEGLQAGLGKLLDTFNKSQP
jgi:hypothetical protein